MHSSWTPAPSLDEKLPAIQYWQAARKDAPIVEENVPATQFTQEPEEAAP